MNNIIDGTVQEVIPGELEKQVLRHHQILTSNRIYQLTVILPTTFSSKRRRLRCSPIGSNGSTETSTPLRDRDLRRDPFPDHARDVRPVESESRLETPLEPNDVRFPVDQQIPLLGKVYPQVTTSPVEGLL